MPLLPLPTSEGKTTRKIRWFPPGHIGCFKDHWTRRRCCHGGTSWARPQSHRLNRLLICLWGPHPLRQVPALFVALSGSVGKLWETTFIKICFESEDKLHLRDDKELICFPRLHMPSRWTPQQGSSKKTWRPSIPSSAWKPHTSYAPGQSGKIPSHLSLVSKIKTTYSPFLREIHTNWHSIWHIFRHFIPFSDILSDSIPGILSDIRSHFF